MPLHALSLIKGEYGRNATLKNWINRRGGGGRILERERRVSEGRGGSVEPAETYCSTNLPHVLLQDGVGRQEMDLEAGQVVMDVSCSAA